MSQTPDVTSLIDQGLAALQAADNQSAQAHFESALKIAPNDPEALHLLGLVFEQTRNRPKAIELIEQAIKIDPREPIFRLNLAAILEKNNALDLAAEHIQAAVSARPNSSELTAQLGAIELKRNNLESAMAAYRRAIEIDPQNVEALAGYGRANLLTGDSFEAKRVRDVLLQSQLASTHTLELALRIAAFERNGRDIKQISQIWKSNHSSDAESIKSLAKLLNDLGYTNEASIAQEALLEIDPDSESALLDFSKYCIAAQRFADARSALEEALNRNPESTAALFALSRLEYFVGDLKTAENICEQVLEKKPDFAAALTHLCALRRGRLSNNQIEMITKLAEDPATEKERVYDLQLALGKALDRKGEIEKAFHILEQGNATGENNTRSLGEEYDPIATRREINKLTYFFRSPPQEKRVGPGPYTPIFVVGTPRSGTTLIESILAAHPETISIGELSSLPEVNKNIMRWAEQTAAKSIDEATEQQLENWRDLYFSYFPKDSDAKYLIDKQPLNIRFVGLIRTLFPDASIIYARRNPVETGFSIFRHPFDRQWPFSYRLEHIADYCAANARIAAHWQKLFGDAFPVFQYETLVLDFENEVRRMLAHCGLPWHDGCLDFHKKKRTIATFSSVQARQPVAKVPQTAADRYAAFLGPLRDGLEAANIDLNTGALAE